MAYDEQLAMRITNLFKNHPDITKKKMYGGIGYLVGGNMACGVNKDDLIVRVGPEAYETALAQPHTKEFDMTGRPMKGWMVVRPTGYETDEALKGWVQRGVDFALSLPPK